MINFLTSLKPQFSVKIYMLAYVLVYLCVRAREKGRGDSNNFHTYEQEEMSLLKMSRKIECAQRGFLCLISIFTDLFK